MLQQVAIAGQCNWLVVLLENSVRLGKDRRAVRIAHEILALWCDWEGRGWLRVVRFCWL